MTYIQDMVTLISSPSTETDHNSIYLNQVFGYEALQGVAKGVTYCHGLITQMGLFNLIWVPVPYSAVCRACGAQVK